jgi:hypothetical protein
MVSSLSVEDSVVTINCCLPNSRNGHHGVLEHKVHFLLLLLLGLVPAATLAQDCAPSGSGLSIHPPIAMVEGVAGSTVFSLENVPQQKTPLKLTAGPFVSKTANGVIPGATVSFTAGDGSGALPIAVSDSVNPPVMASISNVSAVGVVVANVFNVGRCVGQLKAIRFQAPFNFTVESDGSPSAPLQIRAGRDVQVALKNNDDVAYPVTLTLAFDGGESQAPDLTVAANSTAIVRFKTLPQWFDFRSRLRANSAVGHLEVRPSLSAFGDTMGNRAISGRTIGLNAQLAYFNPVATQLISTGIVFVVLLLGGLFSLAANSLLPSTLKKLAYKKRLRSLADVTTAISMKVDSRLRVLLRLERNRLLKLLASSNALASDTNDIFQQVDTGIVALSTRVNLAQKLDELRNRFDREASFCPTSVSDETDQHLQDAADQVRTHSLTDKMVTSASLSLDAADKSLNTLSDRDILVKAVAARHKEMLARASTFSDTSLAALKQALPGIFDVLSQIYDDAHPVLPTNLMQVDDSIARVNTALDYIYVCATTIDDNIQDRLSARNGLLIQLLGTRDWRSLRAARDLVEQMRQNIYPEDLIEDLRSKQARITLDQQVARPYSALELCICFFRYDYNHAKALEQLSCAWTFGDGLGEKGWAVCHFYGEPAKKTITADIPLSICALSNAPPSITPASATSRPSGVQFSDEILVQEAKTSFSNQERFATGFRFAIAFFFALVGLISGAQEQLAKLDILPALIAVFLLGFGADTIKNILTQQNAPQPSPVGK